MPRALKYEFSSCSCSGLFLCLSLSRRQWLQLRPRPLSISRHVRKRSQRVHQRQERSQALHGLAVRSRDFKAAGGDGRLLRLILGAGGVVAL
jgi:hypothetical protein